MHAGRSSPEAPLSTSLPHHFECMHCVPDVRCFVAGTSLSAAVLSPFSSYHARRWSEHKAAPGAAQMGCTGSKAASPGNARPPSPPLRPIRLSLTSLCALRLTAAWARAASLIRDSMEAACLATGSGPVMTARWHGIEHRVPVPVQQWRQLKHGWGSWTCRSTRPPSKRRGERTARSPVYHPRPYVWPAWIGHQSAGFTTQLTRCLASCKTWQRKV